MAGSRLGVQALLVAAGAFVIGLVVGGYAPRSEIRRLESKVFELERGAARSGDGTSAGRELARLLTEGIEEPRTPRARPPAPDDGAPNDGPDEPAPDPFEQDDDGLEIDWGDDGELPPDADPLEAAREMLEVRAAQTRAALVEDISPTDDQLDTIDAALDRMNVQLEGIAQELVAAVRTDGEPSRREMMVLGADVLDVMVEAEASMLDAMDPAQRARVREESTDPTAFVDPGIVDILMDIEDLGR